MLAKLSKCMRAISFKQPKDLSRQNVIDTKAIPQNLVIRPPKGFLWGAGSKALINDEDYFQIGSLPTTEQVTKYLTDFQVQDIKVIDAKKTGKIHITSNVIIGTGLSSPHIAKVLNDLCKRVKSLQIGCLSNIYVMGRQDDPWCILLLDEVGVHLMLKLFRENMNLEEIISTFPDQTEDLEHTAECIRTKTMHEYKMKKKDITNYANNNMDVSEK